MSARHDILLWYGNRLAAMGPAEIGHRMRELGRRRAGRHLGGWAGYRLPSGALPGLTIDEERLAAFSPAAIEDWQDFWRMAKNGRWNFLGQAWPQDIASGGLSPALWHCDPVTGESWPADSYCFDIPFRHRRDLGDIKYVWEINRLQFLPPLAALARVQNNEAVRRWCLDCVESWVEANPPFQGVNWASGIELAIRSVSLLLTVSLLDPFAVPPALAEKLRAAFHAHACWLERYPSAYSSANNHLIAEAGALYMLATAMPDLPGAAGLRVYGLETLEREALRQILPDGVGAEQSPTYTAFVLEWYLLVMAVADAAGDSFADSTIKRLRLAAEHLRWITDDSGTQPRIGDDDEGCVVRSAPGRETHYVAGVMASLAPAVGAPAAAPPVARPHLRNLFCRSAAVRSLGPSGRRSFDAGGCTVFRKQVAGRHTMLVFDYGPIGYLSIAAHGHADTLSIWLHVDGQPVLIDAGTYLYHSGGSIRDRFRGTSVHNTLTLDDANQSRIAGPFSWSSKANAWRLPQTAAGAGVTACHDGYCRRFGCIHQRRVAFDGMQGYLIEDRLRGIARTSESMAHIRYLLSPDLQVTKTAPNKVELHLDGAPLMSVAMTCGEEMAPAPLQVERGEMSPRFGSKISCPVLHAAWPASEILNKAIRTTLCLHPPAENGGVQCKG